MTNRNDYRNWTPDEVEANNIATWERMQFNGVPVSRLIDSATGQPVPMLRMDYSFAKHRLGLRLVTADVTYSLDVEGKPILNEKGIPVEESRSIPAHDWSVNVKVDGLTDYLEKPIPKGRQYFVFDFQPGNRLFNESNCDDLSSRLSHWMLNGEALIKDVTGSGQNEQHRCGAVCKDTLTGSNIAPTLGIPIITIDGCSREAAGSIDTGKKKSTADDFTANASLLSDPDDPKTLMDYKSGTSVGYGQDKKQARGKILSESQGIAKRIILRMCRKNIKASAFTGDESGGLANKLADKWAGWDQVCNMVYAYVTGISPNQPDNKKVKLRPAKVWEVGVAYSLWLLRESAPLESPEALDEYVFPTITVDHLTELQEFLTDLEDGAVNSKGPLAAWSRERVQDYAQKHSDEQSFAQVLLAVKGYFTGQPVTGDVCKASVTGKDKESGSVFSFIGGADRGPKPKEKKAKE